MRLCCGYPCPLTCTSGLSWEACSHVQGLLSFLSVLLLPLVVASVTGAMVTMLSPSEAKVELWTLSLPPTKFSSSQAACAAGCPLGFILRLYASKTDQFRAQLLRCAGPFPVAFPCISFSKLARPLERPTRPLLPGAVAFCLLLLAQILRGECFPPENKDWMFSWLCPSSPSCTCQGHRQIRYFQLWNPRTLASCQT